MSDPEATTRPALPYKTTLNWLDKLRLGAACAVAAAIFWSVGWIAADLTDPLGGVSLTNRDTPWVGWLELVGLAAITAPIAVAIAGAVLPDAGAFAVAFGLAVLSMRSGQVSDLQRYAEGSAGEFYLPLGVEMAGWLVAMVVAMLAGGWVEAWFLPEPPGESDEPSPRDPRPAKAVRPVVSLGMAAATGSSRPRGELSTGAISAAVSVLAGWGLIWLLGNPSDHWILKGQVLFSVSAAMFVAALFSHQIFQCRLNLWFVLAVGILGLLGYGLAAAGSPSALSRMLPLEYISAGTAGAVAGTWFSQRVVESKLEAPAKG